MKPYPGPRPFGKESKDLFFGRDQETGHLASIVIANELVLLYAQSGAGKSSLLNAGLTPLLESKGLEVLPPVRVRSLESKEANRPPVRNFFIYNCLLSLENFRDRPELAKMSLTEYFRQRPRRDGKEADPVPRVLIFDQFEELFTTHQEHWDQRKQFFEDLAEALENDSSLRAILSLREDYLACLDPFAEIFQDRMAARMRLERLDEKAALDAVRNPLRKSPRTFAPDVAEELVNQLLRSQLVDESGQVLAIKGPFVEPVQLQVVCESLWSRLPADRMEITSGDLGQFGDVKSALKLYYETGVAKVLARFPRAEPALRDLFSRKLITPEGTRGMVLRGGKETEKVPNGAIQLLEDLYLIRPEVREGGSRCYEITHDRFIEPILDANRPWFLEQDRKQKEAENIRLQGELKKAWDLRRTQLQVIALVIGLGCAGITMVFIAHHFWGLREVDTKRVALFKSNYLALASLRANADNSAQELGPLLAVEAYASGLEGGDRYSGLVLEALRSNAPTLNLEVPQPHGYSHPGLKPGFAGFNPAESSGETNGFLTRALRKLFISNPGAARKYLASIKGGKTGNRIVFDDSAITLALPFQDSLFLIRWKAGQHLETQSVPTDSGSGFALNRIGERFAYIDQGELRIANLAGRRDSVSGGSAKVPAGTLMAFNPANDGIYLVYPDGTVWIGDSLGEGRSDKKVKIRADNFLVFDGDGKRFATWIDSTRDTKEKNRDIRDRRRAELIVYNADFEKVGRYQMEAPPVPPAFSQDGKLLAVVDADSLFLLNLIQGTDLQVKRKSLPVPARHVHALAFTSFVDKDKKNGDGRGKDRPDAKLAVSVEGSIILFDLYYHGDDAIEWKMEPLLQVPANASALAFSPKGGKLAAYAGQRIIVNFLNKNDLLTLVAASTGRALTPPECEKYSESKSCKPEGMGIPEGRTLMLEGKPEEALIRIRNGMGIGKPANPWVMEMANRISDSLVEIRAGDSAELGILAFDLIRNMRGADSAEKEEIIASLSAKAAQVRYSQASEKLMRLEIDSGMALLKLARGLDSTIGKETSFILNVFDEAISEHGPAHAYRIYEALTKAGYGHRILPSSENEICWRAGILKITDASSICDSAVLHSEGEEKASALDSRGLMRLREGFKDSAKEDFAAFVKYFEPKRPQREEVASRKRWIQKITARNYPILSEEDERGLGE